MKFVAPEMEIKTFATEEILTASTPVGNPNCDNELPPTDFE